MIMTSLKDIGVAEARRPDESLDAYWTRKAQADGRRRSWRGEVN